MAFQKVSDPTNYPDLKTTQAGTVIVENGTYLGTKEGKFGSTHLWREKTGRKVGSSGGQLDYLEREGELVVGQRYRVTYEGKKRLERGTFAGKEANDFTVELDDDSVEEAAAARRAKAAERPAAAAPVKAAEPEIEGDISL